MAEPKPITITPTKKRIAQFWICIDKSDGQGPNGDCWEWIKGRDKDGYGKVTINSQCLRSHRVAYFLEHQDDPSVLLVCHHCDNPPCCNPSHLFKDSNQGNQADMVSKGRQAKDGRTGHYTHPERIARGDRHGARLHPEKFSILTEEKVIKIRVLHASGQHSMVALAAQFGVCRSAIQSVVHRRNWRHVT